MLKVIMIFPSYKVKKGKLIVNLQTTGQYQENV